MTFAQKLALNYIRAKLNILAVISKKKAAKKAFDLFCTPLRKARKKIPSVFDSAEKLSFELEGELIKGYRWNHPREHKVLVIHGFESTTRNFDRFVTPLLRKNYEVIMFDAPAHGRSGGKRITLPHYTKALQTICRLYGPMQGFLAHSFGGLALAHLLESMPHNNQVKAVFIAPATETTSAIDSFFQLLDLNNDIRQEFDEHITKTGGVPPAHYSIRRAIKNVTADILWLHDEDDTFTPLKDALKVKEDQHANIEFVITKGLGHRRIYRDNNVVKRVIEFL